MIKQMLPNRLCIEGQHAKRRSTGAWNQALPVHNYTLHTHLTLLCAHTPETLFCHTGLNLRCMQPGSVENSFALQHSYHNMVRQLTWIHVLLPVRPWTAEHKTFVSINARALAVLLWRGMAIDALCKIQHLAGLHTSIKVVAVHSVPPIEDAIKLFLSAVTC